MTVCGTLRKMAVEQADPIQYALRLGEQKIPLNEYVGKQISLRFTGEIHCVQCGRQTKKSFQQGYCFPCMRRINECDNCMIHPERCHVEEGLCPVDDWAHTQCHAGHVVYLANSSGLKVGITRAENVPMRWIDQGAIQALPIVRVSNRRQAGLVEVLFKQVVNDKTNWRAMLKNTVEPMDLLAERDRLFEVLADPFAELQMKYESGVIACLDEQPIEFYYPALQYPEKIVSQSFDKTPEVMGVLNGIKGQYLLLDSGVINMRKFGGYQVEVSFE
jgi:hypothetical protein